MLGFCEVASHLRSLHQLALDEPAWIGYKEHGHRLRVGLADAALILIADIGVPVSEVRQNAALTVGAVAEENGYGVLRRLVPLAGLTLADLDRVLYLMLGAA